MPSQMPELSLNGADKQLTHDASQTAVRCAAVAGTAAGLMIFVLFTGWIAVRFGLNTPPSATGDEPSYDCIAWQLSQGEGFSVDYDDPDFRRPYDQAAKSQPHLFTLPVVQPGPVAFRPPLFPVIVAQWNVLVGRQFWLTRLMNVLSMAVTAGLMVWFLTRQTSLVAAMVMLAVFCIDTRSRLYARSLLTEPLACLLFTAMAIFIFRLTQRQSLTLLVPLALVTGLSVLTRTIVAVWLPGLTLVLWVVVRRTGHISAGRAVVLCGVFVLLVLIVISPWAIRNISLLDRFAPLGTQGTMELTAGYSDAAWTNGGVWQNPQARRWFPDAVRPGMTSVEAELAVADISTDQAVSWCWDNVHRLPALAAMKVCSELRPSSLTEWVVLGLSLIGLATIRHNRAAAIMAALVLVNLSAVALTWSVEGRFLVPQLFAFYVLAGIGVHQLLSAIRRDRSPSTGDTAAK